MGAVNLIQQSPGSNWMPSAEAYSQSGTGRVFAVEPDPDNGSLLRANIERKDCVNVELLPIAAWDRSERLWLSKNPENPGGSTVHCDERNGDLDVAAEPLDSLIRRRIDLVKTDAEGSDHRVLRGARRLLASCPLAVVEFWREEIVDGLEPHQVLGVLPRAWPRLCVSHR